jgi:hypothetical protein
MEEQRLNVFCNKELRRMVGPRKRHKKLTEKEAP